MTTTDTETERRGLPMDEAGRVAQNMGMLAAARDGINGISRMPVFNGFDSDNYNTNMELTTGTTPNSLFYIVYGHLPNQEDHGHGLALDILMENFAQGYVQYYKPWN